jgi:ribosomal-protein-serine acetyltransferase
MFRALLRPGLDLRLLEERHAPALFAAVHRNREHLREWLPWVDASQTEDDSLSFIRGALDRFASKGEVTAGIWQDGRFCGVIGNHKTDHANRQSEIGYWLAKDAQGQGVMTAACRALTQHLLIELDMNRVEIRCGTANARSNRIPERLGFTCEGVLREAECLYGRYHDLRVWSMLRADLIRDQ